MKNQIKKWKEISRKTIFEKYDRGMEKVIYQMPNSKKTEVYIKKEKPVVCIVALTADKKVILARQFRPGPNAIVYELPGGGIGKNEKLKDAMERELLEETGHRGKIKYVTKIYDCGYSTRIRYCFVATNCIKVKKISNLTHDDYKDGKGFPEEKKVILLSIPKFRSLLRSGKMTDIEVGYLGLDYLGLL